jgi:hypothetical protein
VDASGVDASGVDVSGLVAAADGLATQIEEHGLATLSPGQLTLRLQPEPPSAEPPPG